MIKLLFQSGETIEGETADDVFDGWYWGGAGGNASGRTQEEFIEEWGKNVPGVTPDMPSIDFLRAVVAEFPYAFRLEESDAVAQLRQKTGDTAPRLL